MSDKPVQVLAAEDEPGIRNAICIYLKQAGFEPVPAADGKEALALMQGNSAIRCAVLDVMMPHLDGFALAQEIRTFSDIPILFLTARSEEMDLVQGFSSGGDDYLTKPFSGLELILRIRALCRRYGQLLDLQNPSPSRYRISGLEMDLDAHTVSVEGRPVRLTPKEFAILQLFMEHPGQVFSASQIYESVWQEEAIATETIAVHIRKLREKIEENPRQPRYIQVVWGVGYKLRK